jgi:hypothetical protein
VNRFAGLTALLDACAPEVDRVRAAQEECVTTFVVKVGRTMQEIEVHHRLTASSLVRAEYVDDRGWFLTANLTGREAPEFVVADSITALSLAYTEVFCVEPPEALVARWDAAFTEFWLRRLAAMESDTSLVPDVRPQPVAACRSRRERRAPDEDCVEHICDDDCRSYGCPR